MIHGINVARFAPNLQAIAGHFDLVEVRPTPISVDWELSHWTDLLLVALGRSTIYYYFRSQLWDLSEPLKCIASYKPPGAWVREISWPYGHRAKCNPPTTALRGGFGSTPLLAATLLRPLWASHK